MAVPPEGDFGINTCSSWTSRYSIHKGSQHSISEWLRPAHLTEVSRLAISGTASLVDSSPVPLCPLHLETGLLNPV